MGVAFELRKLIEKTGKKPPAFGGVREMLDIINDDGLGASDWNSLKNRPFYEETGTVEIVPESVINSLTSIVETEETRRVFAALSGFETVKVMFDGTEYSCPVVKEEVNGTTVLQVGNRSKLNSTKPDTGEPFLVLSAQSSFVFTPTAIKDSKISIFGIANVVHPIDGKYLPNGVPYIEEGGMVEILPETTVAFENGEGYIGNAIPLVAGESYTVRWNGVDYVCVAQDASVVQAGTIGIGNGTELGLSGNNEPFIIAVMPGTGTVAMALDGATEAVVSIIGDGTTIRKLDKRCLPDDATELILVSPNGTKYSVTVSDDGTLTATTAT